MNATVDQRWEAALTALAAVERVTIDDVQRVAAALSLDEIELATAVTERRDGLAETTGHRFGDDNAVVVRYQPGTDQPGYKWAVGYDAGMLGTHVIEITDAAPGEFAALLRLLCSGEQR